MRNNKTDKVKSESRKPEMKTRLNKYVANSGICSRREADKFIQAGVVSVNGIGITKMGYKILPSDVVKFNGRIIKNKTNKYFVLNKPKNYTLSINEHKKNALDQFLKNMFKQGLTAIDMLNKMEMGITIFTNDLELSKKMLKKSARIKSIYHITLNKKLTQVDFNKIASGLKFNNYKLTVDKISYINGKEKNEIGLENTTGGLRKVKNIFQKLSYSIIKIDRVFYAGITKKDLPRAKYRELVTAEINILKRLGV